MMQDSKLIMVGVISAAHGVRGDFVVKSFTNPSENIISLPIIDNKNIPFSLKKLRVNSKGGIICSSKASTTRNQAEELVGKELFCKREDLPETRSDEFYFEDLKNRSVVDLAKNKIGVISGVFNFGAGDLIEVTFLDGKNIEIYPFTYELFPEVTKDYVVLSNTIVF